MNELGMVVDVSHASFRTAMDVIEASETPVTFSHDGSYTLASHSFQARRLRRDEELLACARKGGVIRHHRRAQPAQQRPGAEHRVRAGPLRLHGQPGGHRPRGHRHRHQHRRLGRRRRGGDGAAPGPTPARYVDGLESPADGKNIIRGLVARGYSDEDVRRIAGGNALALFRRVMG